ncbi:SNARE associated Golgi protein family [Striga asiatica]|uniref:SNARE associated Golgi protein family n=1 Tax=Striga asiatica TaxID=4170 RepID=A0A5A7QGV5_STRAF|nr:SNARE associated Golgi protein family [Striga asiatica]
MTRNAAGEDLVAGGDYVQLEKCGADGVATCQAEASSSGCCGGGADAGVGGWWWSCWWWAKLVLVVLFVAVLGAVFFKWVGPFFMDKAWLERYPKKASIIRLAGEGSWFNQFRAVTLIRISPFPYVVYNYCAMATDVKYGPYLLGTIVGMIPEIFVALYTGILIRTLADASHDQHSLSGIQIVFNVAGFCITVVSTVIITLYAKKRLKELQMEEELLLP